MKQKQIKLSGKEGFEKYYQDLYGARWQELKKSFQKETNTVEYFVKGAQNPYYLDSASVLVALCLPVKNAQKILDLCAAPGGKTVVLASRMDKESELFANERSASRKTRLQNTVNTCLPLEINSRIKISCSDGAVWCKKQSECFDRILLDAPCSSERHVFLDSKYLDQWTPSRIKTVTMQQWSLLSCAFRLLKENGIMVYSTCALCPLENDLMIEKLLQKFNKEQDTIQVLPIEYDKEEIKSFCSADLPEFEKTKYGAQILPDIQNGAGPIYFSIIKKTKSIV